MIYIIGILVHIFTWGKSHTTPPGLTSYNYKAGMTKCLICGKWFKQEQQ